MAELTDQAVAEFFSIAVQALRDEEELVRAEMLGARKQHNFYVQTAARQPRRLGLASLREEGAGWTVFRALLRRHYPSKYAVEVLWEEVYAGLGKARADFLFRTRDAKNDLQVVACVELKWAAYPERVIRSEMTKMCTGCPDVEVRKFVLIYGVEGEAVPKRSDLLDTLRKLGLKTKPEWSGPAGDETGLYAALGEVQHQ